MIVVVSRIRVVGGNSDGLAEQYRSRLRQVDAEVGRLGVEVLRNLDEPDECVIYRRWHERDDYDRYRRSRAYRSAHARISAIHRWRTHRSGTARGAMLRDAIVNTPGIIAATRAVEARLVQALELEPLTLDPVLAVAMGIWRGAPVEIRTTAYESATIGYARFATVRGDGLAIGNVLCLARPAFPLPVLGADLVAARRDMVMIAADLSPVTPDAVERERQLALLAAARSTSAPLPTGGDLPDWAQAWFSPYALYTRVDPATMLEPALEAFAVFPDVFLSLVVTTAEAADTQADVAATQARYLTMHRTDDKGLRLLAAMFGSNWATRYLETVLFPVDESQV